MNNRNNINKASLVEQATNALKEYINSDLICVGDKLPSEADLCKKYDVSRTTIREALRFLQAMGYVELIPNKGAHVANKNCDDITDARAWMLMHAREVLDVLEVRLALEPLAASLAAERADQTERYAIMGIEKMFEEAAKKRNQSAMVVYDEKLHEAIINASHNTFLIGIDNVIGEALRSFRGRTFSIDAQGEMAVVNHAQVAEAIMQKKPSDAAKFMREHMKNNINIMKMYNKQIIEMIKKFAANCNTIIH